MSRYSVNEVFYSLQGEGMRAGTANVFVRFSGCNLKCDVEAGPLSPGGFACDTEFASGRLLSDLDLLQEIAEAAPSRPAPCGVIFTGGEPSMQLDRALVAELQAAGYTCCIETNGTRNVDHLELDWIALSPKVAEHALKQHRADEVKYVRAYGQGIPRTSARAREGRPLYRLISPAFDGEHLPRRTLDWCIRLVKDNPDWRLSVQQHKAWSVR